MPLRFGYLFFIIRIKEQPARVNIYSTINLIKYRLFVYGKVLQNTVHKVTGNTNFLIAILCTCTWCNQKVSGLILSKMHNN